MKAKFIFNADDFGPIDFINEGVYLGVRKRIINSVQVLVNGNSEDKLRQSLVKLQNAVPVGKSVDVGIHLTLTSGKPLYKRDAFDYEKTWGKMIKKVRRNGKTDFEFNNYTKFYFEYLRDDNYDVYSQAMRMEFDAQRDLLKRLTDEINQGSDTPVLNFSSISNHHNLFTATVDLFEKYVDTAAGNNLALRAPKCLPQKKTDRFYDLVLPLFNWHDNQDDRRMMEELNRRFLNNEYIGSRNLEIKSTSYLDIELYRSLGSKFVRSTRERSLERRVAGCREKFFAMRQTADIYKPHPEREPGNGIVEFVFHLGMQTNPNAAFKDQTDGYPGVAHKYFDDRMIETATLLHLYDEHPHVFDDQVSWSDCGVVKYLKVK